MDIVVLICPKKYQVQGKSGPVTVSCGNYFGHKGMSVSRMKIRTGTKRPEGKDPYQGPNQLECPDCREQGRGSVERVPIRFSGTIPGDKDFPKAQSAQKIR